MMLQTGELSLELRLDLDDDAEAEELDALTTGLRRTLLELDVDSVARAPGPPPPPGARAVDASTLGTLLVTLTSTPELLRALVSAVQGWLTRSSARSVKIKLGDRELEVTGISSQQQERLIDDWIARRAVG
jgi:hypothetical protein